MCPCAGGTPSPIARHCPTGRGTGCAATGLRRASLAVSWGFTTITGSLLATASIGQSIRKRKGLKLKRNTKVCERGETKWLIFETANRHRDMPFTRVLLPSKLSQQEDLCLPGRTAPAQAFHSHAAQEDWALTAAPHVWSGWQPTVGFTWPWIIMPVFPNQSVLKGWSLATIKDVQKTVQAIPKMGSRNVLSTGTIFEISEPCPMKRIAALLDEK